MSELDEAWAAALSEAEQKARLVRARGPRRLPRFAEFQRPVAQSRNRLAGGEFPEPRRGGESQRREHSDCQH